MCGSNTDIVSADALCEAPLEGQAEERSTGQSVSEKSARCIRESEIFDTEFYRAQLAAEEQEEEILDLITHYIERGEQRGLSPHPLFDPKLYRAFNMRAEEEGENAFAHYLAGKWHGKGMTSAVFDSDWYLTTYSDVKTAKVNPLVHYAGWGIDEHRQPCRWFSAVRYAEQLGDVPAGHDSARHFLQTRLKGWRIPEVKDEDELRSHLERLVEVRNHLASSLLFDASFYLDQLSDSERAGVADPVWHYLVVGDKRGISPHPLFSPNLYRKYNMLPSENELNTLHHYLSKLWRGRGITSVAFDSTSYLELCPDVAAGGMNPLQHYVEWGWREGRPIKTRWFDWNECREPGDERLIDALTWARQLMQTELRGVPIPDVDDEAEFMARLQALFELRSRIKASGVFDSAFYSSQMRFVAGTESSDPLWHFIQLGDREDIMPHPLFSPAFYRKHHMAASESEYNSLDHYLNDKWNGRGATSPLFDSSWYIEQNPDVREAKINPLVHYVRFGASEKRPATPWLQSPAQRRRAMPPRERALSTDFQAPAKVLPPALSTELCCFLRYANKPVLDDEVPVLARNLRLRIRACRFLSAPMGVRPAVSIIIPVFNHLRHTVHCLESILAARIKSSFEIIVVNDGSSDATERLLALCPQIRSVKIEHNRGFIEACNRGAVAARGTYLLFLNNDTHVLDDWLDELSNTLESDSRIAIVGSQLISPNGVLQEAGGILLSDGSAFNYGVGADPLAPQYSYPRSVDYCSAASLMISRARFEELGRFDPEFSPAYAEDVDLAFRAREKGYDVVFQPFSKVVHFEGVTSGVDLAAGVKACQSRNLEKLRDRWSEKLSSHGSPGVDLDRERDRGVHGRILVVDSCFPTPDRDAGSMVADAWLRALLELGYHVTFLAVDQFAHVPTYTERLVRMGVCCPTAPYESSASDFVLRHANQFDGVVVNRYTCAAAVYDALDRAGSNIPRLFLPIDLHHLREARLAELEGNIKGRIESISTQYEELKAVSRSALVCVHSTVERELLNKAVPHIPVEVSPIFVPLARGRRSYEERAHLCFIGGFRHPPNSDAVTYFVKEVWPLVSARLPGVLFKIAGSHLTQEIECLASDTVEVIGFVEDVGSLLNSVRLTVAPLRYGAGVKGKVCMSIASGVPVVGTQTAFEGMSLSLGTEVLCGSSPTELADQIVRVYSDRALWMAVADAGFEYARRELSLEASVPRIAGHLRSVGLAT
jgi:GT2 family glycosyltransferase/glycosyltransferase involved in cell wall biosynthesis